MVRLTNTNENLVRSFAMVSSSTAGARFSFVKKMNSSLRPCINYRGLNMITLKNKNLLPLIFELFDCTDPSWICVFISPLTLSQIVEYRFSPSSGGHCALNIALDFSFGYHPQSNIHYRSLLETRQRKSLRIPLPNSTQLQVPIVVDVCQNFQEFWTEIYQNLEAAPAKAKRSANKHQRPDRAELSMTYSFESSILQACFWFPWVFLELLLPSLQIPNVHVFFLPPGH